MRKWLELPVSKCSFQMPLKLAWWNNDDGWISVCTTDITAMLIQQIICSVIKPQVKQASSLATAVIATLYFLILPATFWTSLKVLLWLCRCMRLPAHYYLLVYFSMLWIYLLHCRICVYVLLQHVMFSDDCRLLSCVFRNFYNYSFLQLCNVLIQP